MNGCLNDFPIKLFGTDRQVAVTKTLYVHCFLLVTVFSAEVSNQPIYHWLNLPVLASFSA